VIIDLVQLSNEERLPAGVRRKVGAMVVCKNEEDIIAFSVASVIDVVDFTCIIDNGSTDMTRSIIHHFFHDHLADGRAHLRVMADAGFSMGRARNYALDEFRKRGIDYFVKVDADEVFYSDRLADLCNIVCTSSLHVSELHTWKHELYQDYAQTSMGWLGCLDKGVGVFYDRDMTLNGAPRGPFGHPTIRPVMGAIASGNWTDEAWHKHPENIRYPAVVTARPYVETGVFALAHYGWARCVDHKRAKEEIWASKAQNRRTNYRVNRLDEVEGPWLVPFQNHPESVTSLVGEVRQVLGYNS